MNYTNSSNKITKIIEIELHPNDVQSKPAALSLFHPNVTENKAKNQINVFFFCLKNLETEFICFCYY